MTNREKGLTAVAVILALVAIGLGIALGIAIKEEEKYKAIMDVACVHSTNPTTCRRGVSMINSMSLEQIKSYGF